MARIINTIPSIRCKCKALFEVVELPQGKTQEVVCPACGEHFVYPATHPENAE